MRAPTDQKENVTPPKRDAADTAAPKTSGGSEARVNSITHFGENENDFFMLRSEDTERVILVHKLKQDPRSPDRWLQLLKCPPSYDAKVYTKKRLFRRAINLLPKNECRDERSYVEIWILYAKLEGIELETRNTFTRMLKEKIGLQDPIFYEEYAAFEHNNEKLLEADEILSLGVVNGAFTEDEKEEMNQRIITGRLASNAILPETRSQVPQVPQTPQGTDVPSRVLSTPRNDGRTTPSTVLTTPISGGPAASSGLATVSKIPSRNAGALLNTPSYPARPSLKSQTTSRKTSATTSHLRTLGGPARRVIASVSPTESRSDEDSDDDMVVVPSPKKERKPSPIVEQVPTSSKVPRKAPAVDLSYIKGWAPTRFGEGGRASTTANVIPRQAEKDRPAVSSAFKAEPRSQGFKAEARPQGFKAEARSQGFKAETRPQGFKAESRPQGFKAEPRLQGFRAEPRPQGFKTEPRLDDHLPSPKRLQIDPGVPLLNRGNDLSPMSVSSVSSASSPPALSGDSVVPRDPFSSLTSKVVVKGLTYIKLEQIGSGGSSKVYRMLGPDLKIYAMKKIKLKRLDETSIEQYTNEIQLLQRLQGNPHIIRLVAAEQDLQQRLIHVVMEHGEIDLNERLRDMKGEMNENFLRVIWTQMLQAVHAIHKERIIHSDLKPANFLFVNGALKLIDFGIAKAISNDTTNIERDSQVGTVNYMSPEAIQGNATPSGQRNAHGKMKVGRASDIWSLGCILYQCVYGKPPFADVHSIIEKFRCITDPSIPIPYPALKNKELENVIRSCLQRDHRARPTIDGDGGLLNHPFLERGGNSTGTSGATVTLENAPRALSQLGDLMRSEGVDSDRVSRFMALGRDGIERARQHRHRNSPRIGYNTQERRTEI